MGISTINYKFTNAEVDQMLKVLAEQKLQSLDKLIGDAPSVCDVEFEKETGHQSGDVFRVEVNLRVDGKLYRAESSLESFEKSIDEVRSELDTELSRANDKRDTMIKRGGRKIKEMIQADGQ